MSYMVEQRQYEIAVRSVLDAAGGAIVRLVLGSALRVTPAGIVLGALAAAWAARALHAFLFGIAPIDPLTYLAVAAAVPVIAVAACWRPARRAATVDPMRLLRR